MILHRIQTAKRRCGHWCWCEEVWLEKKDFEFSGSTPIPVSAVWGIGWSYFLTHVSHRKEDPRQTLLGQCVWADGKSHRWPNLTQNSYCLLGTLWIRCSQDMEGHHGTWGLIYFSVLIWGWQSRGWWHSFLAYPISPVFWGSIKCWLQNGGVCI